MHIWPLTNGHQMSQFTEVELEFCKKFIEKIMKHPLSNMYLTPVDPKRDQVENYFKIISEPMDLGIIKRRLDSGEYKNTEEFKYDVNLVWTNSMTYLKKKTNLLYQVAAHMKEKCDKLLKNIPKTRVDEWELKVEIANKRLQNHLALAIPHESLVPRKSEYAIT
ncbi:Bromodomain containing protein [Tritrichomonas foetus]|uniref:Bromodomain containing protein n=1 Tax=Tritrichomonas foetus TaxID=1144522 RepID=A0A1J4JPC3_9EUKA|nr:Bromodomain containing protein [Tritrichomonas foetus]|eukprot:OHT00240.1 Bromodomain containing protein [Tritrichomonas foetus]